jgi:hypothetical protein
MGKDQHLNPTVSLVKQEKYAIKCKKCKKKQYEEALPFRKHVGSSLAKQRQQASAFDLTIGHSVCRILVRFTSNSFGISYFFLFPFKECF